MQMDVQLEKIKQAVWAAVLAASPTPLDDLATAIVPWMESHEQARKFLDNEVGKIITAAAHDTDGTVTLVTVPNLDVLAGRINLALHRHQ